MRSHWINIELRTEFSSSNQEGWAALTLIGDGVVMARVVYWDAVGKYFIELQTPEIELSLLEELIGDATERISGKRHHRG